MSSAMRKGRRVPFGVIGIMVYLSCAAVGVAAPCEDVQQKGLQVLTLNLLFSQFDTREESLERVADFIADHQVHLVLLQEVVGGVLAGTQDSSQDLRDKLVDLGISYELRSRYETGVPGILVVNNAILSRCPILFSLARTLSIAQEDTGDVTIPVRRQVTMVRIRIPRVGKINVYNTHLCADCVPADRLRQVEELLEFLNTVEGMFGADKPLILGGDFNINLNTPDEAPQRAYDLLTSALVDTYAEVNSCTTCCSDAEGFAGCTFGIPGNPFGGRPGSCSTTQLTRMWSPTMQASSQRWT
jgi:maltose 6'-phosphate phosphatase